MLRRALAAMAAGGESARAKLVSTYYDTADRALLRRGLVLRVRQENGHFVQTIKAEGTAQGGALTRGEWEDRVAGAHPDPQAAESGHFLTPEIAGRLEPLFSTEITRLASALSPAPGTQIEAALDRGLIRTADDSAIEPITEIELELKKGSVEALYDIASRLLAEAPLRLEHRSKAERGFALTAGKPAAAEAVHAEPIELDAAISGNAALQRIGRAAIAHALRNEAAIFAGDAEGIHQMRVAVRRLRAALSAFRKMLPGVQRRRASNELRWIADALGDVRNLDVFESALIDPARRALGGAAGLEALAEAAARRRQAAYTAARRAIRSPRYTALMLDLLRWFDEGGWRGSDEAAGLRQPIGDIAPAILDRQMRAAVKRSKGFAGQSPEERHRLRIALKQLRYTIELLGSLYDPRQVRGFATRLKRLQDDLGDANDVRVGQGIVAVLVRANKKNPAIAEAGRRLIEWHETRLAEREEKLRKHLRRLLHSKPFWAGAAPRAVTAAA